MSRRLISIALGAVAVLLVGGLALRLDSTVSSVLPTLPSDRGSEATEPRASVSAPRIETPETSAKSPAEARSGALSLRVTYAEDDAPAAQVGMWLDLGADGVSRSDRIAFTDGEGCARIDDLPAGAVAIEFDRCAGAVLEITAGGTTDFALSIPEGIDIEAHAVADDRPVAGAAIDLFDFKHLGKPLTIATTNSEGIAFVRDVAPNRFLRATTEGYEPSSNFHVKGSPGDRITAQLRFAIGIGNAAFRILDSRGHAAGNADIEIFGPRAFQDQGSNSHFTAGPDGAAMVGPIPIGTWEYRVRHADHVDSLGKFVIGRDPSSEVRVTLRAAGIVRGTVTDVEGRVAAQVEYRLTCVDETGAEQLFIVADTDTAGRFEVERVPFGLATLEFVGRREERGSARKSIQVDAASITICDVRLDSSCEIRGRLVGPDGAPIAGAAVDAMRDRADRNRLPLAIRALDARHGDDQEMRITDADGRFRAIAFDLESRDLAFTVLEYDGTPIDQPFTSLLVEEVAVGSDRTYIVPASALPLSSFSIFVKDADGTPATDSEVILERLDSFERRTLTDDEQKTPGWFRAGSIVAGRYRVRVRESLTGSMIQVVEESREVGVAEHWNVGTVQLPELGTAHFRRPEGSATDSAVLIADVTSSEGKPFDFVVIPTSGLERPFPAGDYLLVESSSRVELTRFVIRPGELKVVRLDR